MSTNEIRLFDDALDDSELVLLADESQIAPFCSLPNNLCRSRMRPQPNGYCLAYLVLHKMTTVDTTSELKTRKDCNFSSGRVLIENPGSLEAFFGPCRFRMYECVIKGPAVLGAAVPTSFLVDKVALFNTLLTKSE